MNVWTCFLVDFTSITGGREEYYDMLWEFINMSMTVFEGKFGEEGKRYKPAISVLVLGLSFCHCTETGSPASRILWRKFVSVIFRRHLNYLN